MIQTVLTPVREWYRSETNWRHVASDLLGTMIALTAAFMLIGYLGLWELANGEWTVENIGFGVGGPLDTFAVALFATPFATPVFYAAWRLADRRYGTRRVPQELAVWLGLGVVLPAVLSLGYAAWNLREWVSYLTAWDGGPIWGLLTPFPEISGAALALSLFPALFTGVYHRLSTGDWTFQTRKFHVTVAVVAVVCIAAVGASAALTPPTDATEGNSLIDLNESDPSDPAAYRDGQFGPDFDPAWNDNQSYGDYQSGDTLTCGEIQPPSYALHDYTPKQTTAGGKNFEIAAGQINTESGVVALETRYSVRLTDRGLRNATILHTGYYGVEPTDTTTYSVGTSGLYDAPGGYDDTHDGLGVRMENVESMHVYVDVIRDGEVHRYTTKLCSNGTGSE